MILHKLCAQRARCPLWSHMVLNCCTRSPSATGMDKLAVVGFAASRFSRVYLFFVDGGLVKAKTGTKEDRNLVSVLADYLVPRAWRQLSFRILVTKVISTPQGVVSLSYIIHFWTVHHGEKGRAQQPAQAPL